MIPKEELRDLPAGGKITDTGLQFVQWTLAVYLTAQLGRVTPSDSWWPEGWER